ncbi:RlpA-like double-psi beta-barrel-protein domain-containing protein-containing protein [Hypoxylon rubiginosum]|uniref:RlpA-like double-psi beta-barrel-protein domain-containing protein-containing protein n=1 Tax=Hypoxylon rubiginosum TaxID=110542 RepID=A0ACB9Z3E4_9PEZI|nr:RlpA-like double-psi beta-barrel-protein domain-containing protein-containing protein [Hypoxylon rubiginosum]
MISLTKIIVAMGVMVAPALCHSGDMTYYTPGLGACGQTNSESDAVVAMSPAQYGHCGKTINIHYKGKSASAKIVDKCPGCAGDSIDVSPKVFQEFTDLAVGRVAVTWEYA